MYVALLPKSISLIWQIWDASICYGLAVAAATVVVAAAQALKD